MAIKERLSWSNFLQIKSALSKKKNDEIIDGSHPEIH
jgi:hypothetical protein